MNTNSFNLISGRQPPAQSAGQRASAELRRAMPGYARLAKPSSRLQSRPVPRRGGAGRGGYTAD